MIQFEVQVHISLSLMLFANTNIFSLKAKHFKVIPALWQHSQSLHYAKEAFVHCHKLCIDTNLCKPCKLWYASALISLRLLVNTELSSAWKQSLTKLFLPFDSTHRASIMLLYIFKKLKHWYKCFLHTMTTMRAYNPSLVQCFAKLKLHE